MRITVVVKTGSPREEVRRLDDRRYEVRVSARPERGKANDAVRRALADELRIAPSRLSLVMGVTARVKVFDVR